MRLEIAGRRIGASAPGVRDCRDRPEPRRLARARAGHGGCGRRRRRERHQAADDRRRPPGVCRRPGAGAREGRVAARLLPHLRAELGRAPRRGHARAPARARGDDDAVLRRSRAGARVARLRRLQDRERRPDLRRPDCRRGRAPARRSSSRPAWPTLDEVRHALDVARTAGAGGIGVLHCVSAYPTPVHDENLRAIPTLAAACGVPVGLSDHGRGLALGGRRRGARRRPLRTSLRARRRPGGDRPSGVEHARGVCRHRRGDAPDARGARRRRQGVPSVGAAEPAAEPPRSLRRPAAAGGTRRARRRLRGAAAGVGAATRDGRGTSSG